MNLRDRGKLGTDVSTVSLKKAITMFHSHDPFTLSPPSWSLTKKYVQMKYIVQHERSLAQLTHAHTHTHTIWSSHKLMQGMDGENLLEENTLLLQ